MGYQSSSTRTDLCRLVRRAVANRDPLDRKEVSGGLRELFLDERATSLRP